MGVSTRIVAMLAIGLLLSSTTQIASAAVRIDPQNVGYTDVRYGTQPWALSQMHNPLSDPLNVGSYIVQLGYNQRGAMAVTAGGRVTSSSLRLGEPSVSGSTIRGDLTIDGAGSMWTAANGLTISNGTLQVTNGGQFNSGYSRIGNYNTDLFADVIIDGPTSRWTISGVLEVADREEGRLTIRNGGQVTSGAANVGTNFGGDALVLVQGAASAWTIGGDLSVGYGGGTGFFTIDQATVTAAGSVRLDRDNNGSYLELLNGTLHAGDLWAAASDLKGVGTIHTGGLISDVDLVFDATHGLQQSFTVAQAPGQNIIIHVDQSRGGALGAGYQGVGTLTIADGVQVSSTAGQLGYLAGASGTATVTGAGTAWNITDSLTVGSGGTGRLTIGPGATVAAGGYVSVGEFSGGSGIHFDGGTLNAKGLTADIRGLTGVGTIHNEGNLALDGALVFDAQHPVGQPIVLNGFAGQNITLHLINQSEYALRLGQYGPASLRIADGQQLTNAEASVGYTSFSGTGMASATITGPGSQWTVGSNLSVGPASEVHVTSGGSIVSNGASLRSGSGGNINVSVDGVGSTWAMTGSLGISDHSTISTFSIRNGGTVSSVGGSIGTTNDLTTLDHSRVVIEGTGSEWSLSGDLRIHPGGSVEMSDGLLDLNGNDIFLLHYTNYPNGYQRFRFSGGTVTEVAQFSGHLVQQGGVVEIGLTSTQMTVTGNYSIADDAQLSAILDSSPPSGGALLAVAGTATLGGTLSLEFAPDQIFSPLAGDKFQILSAVGGIHGTFDMVHLPDVGPGLTASLVYQPNSVLLSVDAVGLAGDHNLDGVVNAADYVVWRKMSSMPTSYSSWRTNYSESMGGAEQASSNVPEPTSLVWILAAYGIFRLRRRD